MNIRRAQEKDKMITDFPHIPARLIDFSSRFCYNGMELFDKSAQTGDIEK